MNIRTVSDLEDIQLELQRAHSLVKVIDWIWQDMPVEDDKDRGWKLELFCQNQGNVEALLSATRVKMAELETNLEKLIQVISVSGVKA